MIQLQSCLARFAAAEEGISFRGGLATRTCRIKSMPRYLLVQIQRYTIDEKWMPTKLDCRVPMPDTLNLEQFRGRGIQPGEKELPEESAEPPQSSPEADELQVAQLVSMDISQNAAKRAVLAVQNAGSDMAASWYFEHMGDSDINDPLESGPSGFSANPEAVAMLSSMGFSQAHVEAALQSCDNNAERAADWLFSHADDLAGAVASLPSQQKDAQTTQDCVDGPGEYRLLGFISHVGKHTSHGHYVCHMRTPSGWVIYDDQKVAKSENPPTDLGYLYLYARA